MQSINLNILQFVACFVVIAILIFSFFRLNEESFATKSIKSQELINWYTRQQSPTYIKYKGAFGEDANYVDYNHIKKLSHAGELTRDNLIKYL